jgi:membrane protein DedA with SNARE-associated domain/rhodanese-related sulfurtransferase
MLIALDTLLKYGYLVLFGWVLLEQIGVPIPSVPVILAVGTLTATHQMNWALAMFAILLACGLSDSFWYFLGQRYGNSILRQLCRISLEPGTCVQKTKNSFTHRGVMTLLWAKFVPGLSAVAPPIAGQTGISYSRFLLFDLAGSVLWGGGFLLAGRFFGDAIKRNAMAWHWMGHSSGVLLLLLIFGLIGYRLWKRDRFLKSVAESRISPESLKLMLDSGENPFIVDLRHPLDYLPDPRVVPTSIRMAPDEVARRIDELPHDRDIILYCTCPSDASSAATALKLHKLGIVRVRPLYGGFEAWKNLQYPLVEYPTVSR